jgi:NAD(P)-dependent dehydrogenase (short-subunit alcohol dehydrogenase family)
VNNAGTEGKRGRITEQTAESYAATFDTNVLGVVLSMKHEVRAMQAQGSGNVINISSTYGHEGAAGASIYVGAKHAVEGISKSVALELAKSGIRVNAVAPGPTDTGMLTRFTAGEQGGSRHDCSDGPPRSSGGACQCDRLRRLGRSFIHHRPRPQRRRRQNPLASPVRARSKSWTTGIDGAEHRPRVWCVVLPDFSAEKAEFARSDASELVRCC